MDDWQDVPKEARNAVGMVARALDVHWRKTATEKPDRGHEFTWRGFIPQAWVAVRMCDVVKAMPAPKPRPPPPPRFELTGEQMRLLLATRNRHDRVNTLVMEGIGDRPQGSEVLERFYSAKWRAVKDALTQIEIALTEWSELK